MDLDDALRTGALVKSVDILGDEEEAVAEALLHLRDRPVAGVRLHRLRLLAPQRVELPHEFGIARETLGRGHVLDPVLLPQAVRVAEGGEAALRGNAGPGQDEEARAFLAKGLQRGELELLPPALIADRVPRPVPVVEVPPLRFVHREALMLHRLTKQIAQRALPRGPARVVGIGTRRHLVVPARHLHRPSSSSDRRE